LPLSNGQDKLNEFVILNFDRAIIEFQEKQRCFQTDTLVSIDKRMVLYKVKQIRSCHLEHIGMERCPAECRRWLSERRFQQSNITDSIGSAVDLYLVLVNLKDVVDGKKLSHHCYSASFLKTLA
jgi:hypothetical protein